MSHLSPDQAAAARRLRDLLDHYTAGAVGGEKDRRKSAYERMILELSFTILNRLAALRLCEERGLVVECVRRGTASDGFRLFERVSGGALGGRYDTYRVFLECLFDELALDLGVLFDRTTPQSSVFPSERCMEDVLGELNKPELTHLWTEDETIGWVYQYFNPPEERKAMRDASQAPRNSRELAVRNQFFTPRYVVEFLTDNTLGRIWYEMRKGDTALKDECCYLVRRPNEVFLAVGEKAQSEPEVRTDLSQEELLKQTFYIEHRPKKDPRDLCVLDPACGSGHFLLYAFDLLERIYEEAWSDPESPKCGNTGRTLQEEFKTLDDLRRKIPKLIMEHNLHGIDIDPRAVQIAALALWLRAQNAWKNLGIKAAERPRVAKSNIVTAEPMPGEKDMKEEFTAGLKPRVLGQLVDAVFDQMKLAGEAGSLLKIEEEIKDVVSKAKEEYRKELRLRKEEAGYLPGMAPERAPTLFDFADMSDEDFLDQSEDAILEALKQYAERAENGYTVRRRLFADDAARGFAFIDLCRKCYDVVLMNPPFGDSASAAKSYLGRAFPTSKYDLFAMFVVRWLDGLNKFGRLGAITNKTGFFLQTFAPWRKTISSGKSRLEAALDLGFGVLDSAMVETMSYVLSKDTIARPVNSVFIRLTNISEKDSLLDSALLSIRNAECPSNTWLRQTSQFESIPNQPMCYWAGKEFLDLFRNFKPFAPDSGHIYQGIATGDNFRFLRCRWEVPSMALASKDWVTYAKGGVSTLWYSDFPLVVLWAKDGSEIKANAQQCYGSASRTVKNEIVFFKAGLTYTQVTVKGFFARVLPQGCVFDMKGPSVILKDGRHVIGLGVFCSIPIRTIAKLLTDCRQWHPTNMMCVPYPTLTESSIGELQNAVTQLIEGRRRDFGGDETSSTYGCRTTSDISKSADDLSRMVDDIVAGGFGSQVSDFVELDSILSAEHDDDEDEDNSVELAEVSDQSINLISQIIGILIGRWDIRTAIEPSLAPRLADPFSPLPVCPPGMLIGPGGLPAESGGIVSEKWLRARPDANKLPPEDAVENPTIPDSEYPLRIAWNGILVDDPGLNSTQPHRDDIVRRVREVLDLLWKEKAHEIEQEACDILGVSDLRDYFRKPAKFFQDHLKRYSKSRRKAPIYWPLSTASGSYTIWIYYHRLNDQTLYAAVNNYVDPKISEVERGLARIEDELKAASGGEATRLRDRLNETQAFLGELRDLREELLRIAALPYKPDLNDGVIINAAPLNSLFNLRSWANDTKKVWDKLKKGDYDWAHLAYTIWPDRVRDACKKDRSIAIAHGLEELCEVENPTGKKKGGRGRRRKEAAR
jgi:hypothetical protein